MSELLFLAGTLKPYFFCFNLLIGNRKGRIQMFFLIMLITVILIIFLFFEYGFAQIIKYFYLRKLRQTCRSKLVLTYDDGPGERLESNLLDLLAKHKVKATFFLNSKRAEQFPQRCDILKQSGHELGYHCYEHFYPYKKAPWVVWSDIDKAYNILRKWLPEKKVFRFPYGKFTTSVLVKLIRRGVRIAYWTVDSGDTYPTLPSPELVADAVLNAGGCVVLMHSFDRISESVVVEDYVVELTDLLIRKAKERAWQICSFSEMIDISEKQRS